MMLKPPQIEDEIFFWLGQQEREHMFFMVLGTQEAMLRSEATRLLQAYEDAAQRRDARALLALAPSSQALKQNAFQAASQQWVGWLYPSIYEHMISEINYALARIHRDVSVREITCFWAKERSDVAITTAKLLDPIETQLTMQGMRHHALLRDLYAACRRPSMGNLSANVYQATAALDGYLESSELAKAKKVIHPMLAQHELREGKRGETVLQTLYLSPT